MSAGANKLALLAIAAGCGLLLAACASSTRQQPASDAGLRVLVTIHDSASSLRIEPGATPQMAEPGANYRGSAYAQRVSRELQREFGLDEDSGWRIGLLDVYCVVFRVRSPVPAPNLLAKLAADPRVQSAQLLNRFETRAQNRLQFVTYDDPYFRLQSGLDALHVPEAQRWSAGRGVRVAVIDTGVDTKHPDLAGRIESSRNFVAPLGSPPVAERHGTAVAGVIAAVANNGIGIVGVAPGARLLLLRACWQDGVQAQGHCDSLTLARALEFAVERHADAINLSLAGPRDALLEKLVGIAIRRGIVVVGAMDEANEFPAAVPGVVAVADSDQPPAAYLQRLSVPVLGAPGREILTLVPGGHYDFVSGSSMSAALASGVVALLLATEPGGHAVPVGLLLQRTAQASAAAGRTPLRLIDACQAMAEQLGRAPCTRSVPIEASAK